MSLNTDSMILVIEDNPINMADAVRSVKRAFSLNVHDAARQILQAVTRKEAIDMFRMHMCIVGIGIDGCIDSPDDYDAGYLIRHFRNEGFTGPIVAMSKSEHLRNVMINDGCSHRCREKFHLGDILENAINKESQ